jgi:hypothetical protein
MTATYQMIIYYANCLQMRIDDCGADEAETAFFQVLTYFI